MRLLSSKRQELDPSRRNDKLIIVLLILVLVATSLLRIAIIVNKTTLEYDEAISYLTVTCNQSNFSNTNFVLHPIPAAEWKQYLSLERPFCFGQIQYDLIQNDVHPPLYFWVLHLWVMLFGVHLWTGPALNILIAFFATLALFMLAKNVLHNIRDALLVVVSYALNPSVVLISKEARQYDLLILCLILTVWFTHIMIKNQSTGWGTAVFLMFMIAAGNVTTYLFFLTVPPACLIYATWRMIKSKRPQLLRILVSLLVGYGVAIYLNPNFWVNINRQAARNQVPTWTEFSTRLGRVVIAFASFYYILIPLVLLMLGMLYAAWRHQGKLRAYMRSTNFQGWTIIFFLVWFAGLIIGMYLTFLTPIHTIGSSKYLSMVWPFLSFLPVFLLRLMHYRRTVLLYLVLIPLLWLIIFPVQMSFLRLPDPTPQLMEADLILIDNPARGVLFPLLWHVPDQTMVIVAYQEQLLAGPEIWLPFLKENTLYVNQNDIPNIPEQGATLLRLITGGYHIDQPPQDIVTLTTVYNAYILLGPR